YILAIFTVGNSKQTEIIPFVSQVIAQEFSKTAPKADFTPAGDRIRAGDRVQQRQIGLSAVHMKQNKKVPSPRRAEIRSIPGSPWRWAFVYYSLWQGVAL
ncbi:MAG TPA: hypothetical protein VNH83_15230, partial [Bryobacteraceae bacterium]|nr:hypothetical protein [Bryobacteraceae bacterium]